MLAMALTACGTTNWGFPYRPDVQQGNWITTEQVAQLQEGMTREQVRFILGTPTLQDIFRTNRWDYPYYNKPGYGKEEERKFTVWFEGDTLVRWEGDDQPDRQPYERTDTGASATTPRSAPPSESALPPAQEAPPAAAQSSPVDANAPASPSADDAAQAGEPDTQPSVHQEHRAILNADESRPVNPGVPTPGRNTAEPLR
ncbi:outer membrane protein assembly factor BamE [Pusillimonas sp. SM2304]|uniref:outer membrane protein assembly factor BamE n=1 Tax=Pusillimonas sp. SM2304 TaxID=3073241 RepID=UPI002876229E|nr:outer membrane protein assembly factor BamE [Pusillimonas sp. SM2304]MDS1140802.1 outer membrane protein assembly factor BamE [Pusillimonas sp. SM2304]